MCNCIEKLNEEINDALSIELIDGNKLCLDYSACRCGAFEKIIEINYCPICGEKLKNITNNKIK